MSQQTVDPKVRSHNRKVVSALVLVFAAPVILAYVAMHMGWFHVATKNNGTLLDTPYPHFDQFEWFGVDEQPLHFKDFETQWWWIYFPEQNTCDAACELNIHWLTQTHATLGKESEKLTRLIVFPDDIIYEYKVQDSEQLRLARGNGQPTIGDGVQLETGKIYLMDVHGNIFMRYEPVADEQEAMMRSKGLRDDVRRAIKSTGL